MKSGKRCPYCMSPIDEREQFTVCASCGTAHHRECWEENGGCCVRVCPQVSRTLDIDLPRERSDRLVLSREAVESARPRRSRSVSNPCMRCGKQVPQGELYCVECRPGPPESEDTRNLWPILVMLAFVAVILAGIVILAVPTSGSPDTSRVTDRAD